MKQHTMVIPADVPSDKQSTFAQNYSTITRETGNLLIFAADQKIEHLNQDFYGEHIHPDAAHPEHLFAIAQQGTIGCFATHPGLIARYAQQYPGINYLAKLNAKTNLVPTQQQDPLSLQLFDIDELLTLADNGANICAVGYTIYLGSEHEAYMLEQAAQIITTAHQHGLVAVLWIYPRGQAVTNPHNIDIIAGAAGVANSLGADFVKITPPEHQNNTSSAELLRIAVDAAGNTGVLCSGGPITDPKQFLQQIHDQLQIGGTRGCAVGRNIHSKSRHQAIAMTHALSALVYEEKSLQEAVNLLKL